MFLKQTNPTCLSNKLHYSIRDLHSLSCVFFLNRNQKNYPKITDSDYKTKNNLKRHSNTELMETCVSNLVPKVKLKPLTIAP